MSETWQPGHYGPTQQITYRDKTGSYTVNISAGSSDSVDVFREGGVTYVLSINRSIGYVGVQAFKEGQDYGDVFLQNDWEIREALGPRGLDLQDVTIARKLSEYIQ